MARQSTLPTLFGGDRDPFTMLRKRFDDIFDDWMTGPAALPAAFTSGQGFAPSIDVSETDNELKICADLPGLEDKDVEVKLAGNQLTIRGEKKAEHEEKNGGEKGRYFHRVERSYGSFQRSISLPFDVDPEKVDASFKNGVLTVTLPKPAEVQQAERKIEIKKAN